MSKYNGDGMSANKCEEVDVESAAQLVVNTWDFGGSAMEVIKNYCSEENIEYSEALYMRITEVADNIWQESCSSPR